MNGTVRLKGTGFSVGERTFSTPRPIAIAVQPGPVELDLACASEKEIALEPRLAVEALTLHRIDDYASATLSSVRPISTVLAGAIYFDELNGQERSLREGELISSVRSSGELLTATLGPDGVVLQFHGRVAGLASGGGTARASLMPTWLQWWNVSPTVRLVVGALLSAAGLIAGGLRWWRGAS